VPSPILRPPFVLIAMFSAAFSLAPICGDGDKKVAAPTPIVAVTETPNATATGAPTPGGG
jgi:hypothetical protein